MQGQVFIPEGGKIVGEADIPLLQFLHKCSRALLILLLQFLDDVALPLELYPQLAQLYVHDCVFSEEVLLLLVD